MSVALFIGWPAEAPESVPEDAAMREIPGASRLSIFTPPAVLDGLVQEADAPAFALQIEFDGIDALEAASVRDGALSALCRGAREQQAFLVRRYLDDNPPGRHCSYLVHYPGPAEDCGAWLAHYAAHHIPLMCRLPRIRGVEMLTRIDWISELPLPRSNHMQRNRVTFDGVAELLDALNSPIRTEMRADVADYPPYQGGMHHFAMETEVIFPAAAPNRKDIS